MRKRILVGILSVISLTVTTNAFSQSKWGVEAGVNIANIKGDDISDETNSRTGLLLALYYQLKLANGPVALQPEIIYSQKGLEYGNDGVIKLDYLVATGLVAYYLETTGKVSPFLKAGPYVGFNIKAEEEFSGHSDDINEIKNIDAGVIIRAGIQIDRFEVGARLSKGLTDVLDNEDAKNSVFGFFMGVTF